MAAASDEYNKVGPDYFGFYTHQVADLLSEDEVFEPFSFQNSKLPREQKETDTSKLTNTGETVNRLRSDGSLFSNGIASGLSDLKKERLKGLLRQSVTILTREVDEMLDPVVATRRLLFQLRDRNPPSSYSGAASNGSSPRKKPKILSSNCSSDAPLLESRIETDKENEVVNDDLKFLLENDRAHVEQTTKKYSQELFSTLEHMEQHLEKLLNTVTAKSRLMTLFEKQRLQTMIQNLQPENLDRVVEIIQHGKGSDTSEHFIDLEEMDNTTLWRLYYYVEAVANARKLAM